MAFVQDETPTHYQGIARISSMLQYFLIFSAASVATSWSRWVQSTSPQLSIRSRNADGSKVTLPF